MELKEQHHQNKYHWILQENVNMQIQANEPKQTLTVKTFLIAESLN